ncbi:MAG: VTT domain-containing protein [Vicingaceae bacterium]
MGKIEDKKEKKGLKKNIRQYHFFYKRKGVYPFMLKNTFRLLLGLGALVLLLYFFRDYMPDLEYYFELMTVKFRPFSILLVFFLSESLFGLIPPDFFILWGRQFNSPYAMIALLATLSYGGGVISYILGSYVGSFPKIQKWMNRKFLKHIDQVKKWGGILIVFAALFPLPFSPVCMAAGMIRFPVRLFLLLGIFRFVRFFAYGYVLFNVV